MSDNWIEYISEKEKFKALFPAPVKRKYKGFFTDDGISPGTVIYKSRIGFFIRTIYQVTVTRVMEYYGSPQNFMNDALGEQLKIINGAELKDKNSTTFKGYPALEYNMTVKSSFKLKGIMVLVNKTLYTIFVLYPPNKEPMFEKFLNSFETKK